MSPDSDVVLMFVGFPTLLIGAVKFFSMPVSGPIVDKLPYIGLVLLGGMFIVTGAWVGGVFDSDDGDTR